MADFNKELEDFRLIERFRSRIEAELILTSSAGCHKLGFDLKVDMLGQSADTVEMRSTCSIRLTSTWIPLDSRGIAGADADGRGCGCAVVDLRSLPLECNTRAVVALKWIFSEADVIDCVGSV